MSAKKASSELGYFTVRTEPWGRQGAGSRGMLAWASEMTGAAVYPRNWEKLAAAGPPIKSSL